MIRAHTDVVICKGEALKIYMCLSVLENLANLSAGYLDNADFISYN